MATTVSRIATSLQFMCSLSGPLFISPGLLLGLGRSLSMLTCSGAKVIILTFAGTLRDGYLLKLLGKRLFSYWLWGGMIL